MKIFKPKTNLKRLQQPIEQFYEKDVALMIAMTEIKKQKYLDNESRKWKHFPWGLCLASIPDITKKFAEKTTWTLNPLGLFTVQTNYFATSENLQKSSENFLAKYQPTERSNRTKLKEFVHFGRILSFSKRSTNLINGIQFQQLHCRY